jgi:hypothetical protein
VNDMDDHTGRVNDIDDHTGRVNDIDDHTGRVNDMDTSFDLFVRFLLSNSHTCYKAYETK